MISRENALISTTLACLALTAIFVGQWMTRPMQMGPLGSVVALIVIYAIVAGVPQMLIFAAAVSCSKEGHTPPATWWAITYLVFAMQFGAGASLIAGALVGDERLLSLAAVVLMIAALVAVASGLAASRVVCGESEAAGKA